MNRPILLQVHKVSKSFPASAHRFAGIKNISLTLRAGEVVCIVGPSGAGKSSLLRVLAGLDKPDSGIISYANSATRKAVFVAQNYDLWPNKTVLENIILAPMVAYGASRATAIAQGYALLDKFGLRDKAEVFPARLSGGQRQRVALIRALAVRPQILLLDEITSALDPELIKSILDTIRIFAKEGQAMIVVTHHLSFAAEVGDRILFLEHGELVQDSTARDFVYAQANARVRKFLKTLSAKEQEINVFEGDEQFQSYHIGLVKRLPEGSTIYIAGGIGARWYQHMGRYFEEYDHLRRERNIAWKMLLYDVSPQDRALQKDFPHINDFRRMPSALENPANYNVMGDAVILQTFGEKPSVIEIKNGAIARAYLNYFNDLWAASSPL